MDWPRIIHLSILIFSYHRHIVISSSRWIPYSNLQPLGIPRPCSFDLSAPARFPNSEPPPNPPPYATTRNALTPAGVILSILGWSWCHYQPLHRFGGFQRGSDWHAPLILIKWGSNPLLAHALNSSSYTWSWWGWNRTLEPARGSKGLAGGSCAKPAQQVRGR